MRKKENKQNELKEIESIIYLNREIDCKEVDEIGILSHVESLQKAIDSGAEMIAITSDFGGGKSSLVNLLELENKKNSNRKFCKVNLWSQLKDNMTTIELHKAFLYQLAYQIKKDKGEYVCKRLSNNYGLLKINFKDYWAQIGACLVLILLVILSIFNFCGESIEIFCPFLKGQSFYVKLIMIALILFMLAIMSIKSEMVFSTKDSQGNLVPEENEIIDIYRRDLIGTGFFKHFIIIIDDLDRTDNDSAVKFIKNLRKYYISQVSRKGIANIIKNKVTIIVSVKPESQLIKNEKNIYSKIFDYIINLSPINIDNYDTILEGLLKEKRESLKQINLISDDVRELEGFEWFIRGKNISLRNIKERLNNAFLSYKSLVGKFGKERIKFEKCAAMSYFIDEFSKEFYDFRDDQFENLVEKFIIGEIENVEDVITYLNVREYCAEEILQLLESKNIDSDYRTYFYNYPKNSKLYRLEETKIRDIILYDESIDSNFAEIYNNVKEIKSDVINLALQKKMKLTAKLPAVVFKHEGLYKDALKLYPDETINQLSKISDLRMLEGILNFDKERTVFNNDKIKKLTELWVKNKNLEEIKKIREMICNVNKNEIIYYKELFFIPHGLITEKEINMLNVDILLEIINKELDEFDLNIFKSIHSRIISEIKLGSILSLNNIVDFYIETLGIFENSDIIEFLVEYMLETKTIIPQFEDVLVALCEEDEEYINDYIEVINICNDITDDTLHNIKKLKIYDGLNMKVCELLYKSGLYLEYFFNVSSENYESIDYSDGNIIKTIKENSNLIYDFDKTRWIKFRKLIIEKFYSSLNNYEFMFSFPFLHITQEELNLISNVKEAIKLIDIEQIDEESENIFVEYFNRSYRNSNETYEILILVSKVLPMNLAEKMFYKLNMERVVYRRMSKEKIKHIKNIYKLILDLDKADNIIKFMNYTNKLDEELENTISDKIKIKDNKELIVNYVNLINKLDNDANDCTINNIINFPYLYAYGDNVNNILFENKLYKYYIVSKIRKSNSFEIEEDKLEELWNEYIDILSSGGYSNTRGIMSQNTEFITMAMNENKFKNLPEENRLYFVNVNQTVECLEDLVNNYSIEYIIKYLSQIKGFKDKEAAEKFIEIISDNEKIAADTEIYNNNYEKLIDSILKRKYTIFHKKAQGDK